MKYKIKRIQEKEFKNMYWNHIGPSWSIEQTALLCRALNEKPFS